MQEKTTDALRQILSEEYALHASSLVRMERGYTNESYDVRTGDSRFVLRRSWRGKPVEQAHREERVLRWLESHAPALPAPRLVATTRGKQHIGEDTRTLHLFGHRAGQSPYSWKHACSREHLAAIMQILAQLHEALHPLPAQEATSPLRVLDEQLSLVEQAGIAARYSASPTALRLIHDTLDPFVARGRAILNRAATIPAFASRLVWCHGDLQLENLLLVGEEVTGLLDFDTVRALPLEMDLAFALFSLTRDGTLDDHFDFDPERWHLGAALYNGCSKQSLAPRPEAWRDLFCLDQALLHLHAGLRGIWCLDLGIGFVAAYRGVLQS